MTPLLLAAEMADLEVRAVAEAERKFNDIHGGEADWSAREWDSYDRLMTKVQFLFRNASKAVA
jgi:hypothetical protein